MKYITLAVISLFTSLAFSDRDPNEVLEPKFPYIDMNNNGSYEAGVDRPLNRDQVGKDGGILVPPEPDASGISPGFVLPSQVNLRGYHLRFHLYGNIIIRGNLNTRHIVGGFQVGLLEMQSYKGSIIFGERTIIHPDIFSIRAHQNIEFGKKSSLFQFQRGFAIPRIYGDTEDVRQYRGFQEIISENGNIVVSENAKIDGNDQLIIEAKKGSIISGTNSYLRSQSELQLLALQTLQLSGSRISSVVMTLSVQGDANLSGVSIIGTRLQCKIGNGRVPGCVDQPHFLRISAENITFTPVLIRNVLLENILLD